MWISLFTIVLAIALSLGVSAAMLEFYWEENHRARKSGRSLRRVRQV